MEWWEKWLFSYHYTNWCWWVRRDKGCVNDISTEGKVSNFKNSIITRNKQIVLKFNARGEFKKILCTSEILNNVVEVKITDKRRERVCALSVHKEVEEAAVVDSIKQVLNDETTDRGIIEDLSDKLENLNPWRYIDRSSLW